MFRASSRLSSTLSRVSRARICTPRPVFVPAVPTMRFERQSVNRYYSADVTGVLNGTNAYAIEELHQTWKEDPSSVDSTWNEFFTAKEEGRPFTPPARTSAFGATSGAGGPQNIEDSFKVFLLIRAYRVLGHFLATLDPLNLEQAKFIKVKEEYKRELDPANYGFTAADMDREFYVGADFPGKSVQTLRETIQSLQRVYCGDIGVQYMHAHDPSIKSWVKEKIESGDHLRPYSVEEKKKIFRHTAEAETFEKYCGVKFNAKRFGLDGGEALIPGMHALVEAACNDGVQNVVIGMPHRGRLNVMANIMDKPLKKIFSEFQIDSAKALSDSVLGSGDVKYHLGTSNDRKIGDKSIHLSLAANPSHLEAVNPVVIGKTRAKQTDKNGEVDPNKAMGVLIHGDAAFAGQGIVGECIELSGLADFDVGGTIHVVVNNQIGFTTVPKFARTSPYPSEIAKAAGTPIFHVNGDNPEAVARVFELAVEFRQKFRKDIVIDMYCYRRFGHNELDEPRFTQPRMYQKIATHPSVTELFGAKLEAEGTLTKAQAKQTEKDCKATLKRGFTAAQGTEVDMKNDWLECHWKGLGYTDKGTTYKTGVNVKTIKDIMKKLVELPENFQVHPKLNVARFDPFKKMIETGTKFNWAMGEALAFGSLLLENYEVRVCGQDCERGTFNHRHAVLYDQETEKTYQNLKNLAAPGQQGHFNVINSSLSENAVLGFEHGYSLENPNALVVWEAQFGDFVNGAQVIIDQFITSGEQKWLRMSGLTMFLPHGFEGQGPEHSSGRVERFLQACDDHPKVFPEDAVAAEQEINLQVANISTPANMFHLLRRQLHRNYRKPLVVMTPKSLFTRAECVSDIEDFGPDSIFHRLIADSSSELADPSDVKRVVFCSGKVYYDLDAERKKIQSETKQKENVALVRIEQIAPFPFDLVKAEVEKFPNAELVWVQEEPMNQGPWSYVEPRLETATGNQSRPRFIGRPPSAAPATGLGYRHAAELRTFLDKTFDISKE